MCYTFTPVQPRIYFENGTCKCEGLSAGATATINGTTYTVADNSTIAGQISNGNVNLCTTLVTNMNELFKDNSNFNSNINFWDTLQMLQLQGDVFKCRFIQSTYW